MCVLQTETMTVHEAIELLLLHSFMGDDVENPKMTTGFLGSLRPYKELDERNFEEIMQALRVLAPRFQDEKIDQKILSALWCICHLGRAWGVHPDGMLRRNNLIAEADSQRLDEWIDAVSYAVMMLLEGDIEEAFANYEAAESGDI